MGFFGWGRGGAISSANFEGVWEGREGASFAGGLGSVGPHILTKKAPVLLEVFLPPLQEDAGAGKKQAPRLVVLALGRRGKGHLFSSSNAFSQNPTPY